MHGAAGFCAFGSAAWHDAERSAVARVKLENRIVGPSWLYCEHPYGVVLLRFIDGSLCRRRAVSCLGGFGGSEMQRMTVGA